jgi:hypothetical protein
MRNTSDKRGIGYLGYQRCRSAVLVLSSVFNGGGARWEVGSYEAVTSCVLRLGATTLTIAQATSDAQKLSHVHWTRFPSCQRAPRIHLKVGCIDDTV